MVGETVSVQLNTVERCSGHAGTYGVKSATHAIAMKIGKPVFRAMAEGPARLHQLRLPARRPPHRAGHGRQRAAAGAAAPPADPDADRLRTGVNMNMAKITRESLLTLEAYAKVRAATRAEIIAHRKLRTRAARRARQRAVRGRAHDPPPDPGDAAHREDLRRGRHPERDRCLRAAGARRQQLEGDDAASSITEVHERKRELARLIGVEDRLFVEVEGHARVYAIADEDLERENDDKTVGGAFRALRVPASGARPGARRRGGQARLRPHELPGPRDDRARDPREPGRRPSLTFRRHPERRPRAGVLMSLCCGDGFVVAPRAAFSTDAGLSAH